MGLISRVSSRTYRNMLLKTALIASLTALVANAEFEKEEGVLVLGDSDFAEAIASYDYVLAEFYAPWCGHCKTLAPEFAKAAQALAGLSNVTLAKVDATVHAETAKKYGVRGYPTLKWFKKDPENAMEYGGGRKDAEIQSWIKKKTGPAAVELADVDAAKKIQEDNEVVVVGYFAEASKDDFIAVADKFDDVPFAFTSNADVAAELDLADGGITLFKKFDEGFNKFEAGSDLADFVKANSLAYVTEFSDKTAPKIFGGEIKKHILMFSAKSASDHSEIMDAFTASAKTPANRGQMLFVHIDCDKSDNGRILEFFGLKEEECPDVRIIEMGKTMQKFKPESENLDKAGFDGFVNGVLEGTIKRHLMSDEIPEDNTAGVTILLGKQFDELVKENREKSILIEFYAPWCGHCKQLAPVWDKLGEHFADNDDVMIMKADSTTNEFDGIEVQGFPTLKFFPKGEYKVVDYNGGRDFDALKSFVENEGQEPAEEEEADDEDEEEVDDEPEDYEPAQKDEL